MKSAKYGGGSNEGVHVKGVLVTCSKVMVSKESFNLCLAPGDLAKAVSHAHEKRDPLTAMRIPVSMLYMST